MSVENQNSRYKQFARRSVTATATSESSGRQHTSALVAVGAFAAAEACSRRRRPPQSALCSRYGHAANERRASNARLSSKMLRVFIVAGRTFACCANERRTRTFFCNTAAVAPPWRFAAHIFTHARARARAKQQANSDDAQLIGGFTYRVSAAMAGRLIFFTRACRTTAFTPTISERRRRQQRRRRRHLAA